MPGCRKRWCTQTTQQWILMCQFVNLWGKEKYHNWFDMKYTPKQKVEENYITGFYRWSWLPRLLTWLAPPSSIPTSSQEAAETISVFPGSSGNTALSHCHNNPAMFPVWGEYYRQVRSAGRSGADWVRRRAWARFGGVYILREKTGSRGDDGVDRWTHQGSAGGDGS